MGKKAAAVHPGDIFTIPLFLPSNDDDYTLDYSKYKFPLNDIYAFGRLIEIQVGNVDLIEVFSYTGRIPENPHIIIQLGRMFAPEHIGHPFSKNGRWRAVFSNPYYDMWRDSDYENISFLSPVGHMWKGKETINITKKQCIELEEAGMPYWIMHSRTDLEVEIRSALEEREADLDYERIVDERKSEFPKPRDVDKKLKEMIVPFRWLSEPGRYTLSLNAGLLNGDCFAKNNMLGNGYDWEKVASEFIKKQGIHSEKKFSFDCEEYMEENYPDECDNLTEDDFLEIIEMLRKEFQNTGNQENFLKLDMAFTSLSKQGIVALHYSGYTQSDGFEDCNEVAAKPHEKGQKVVGCCFYTEQDLGHILHGDSTLLYLSFGNYFEKPTAREVGQIIAEELKSVGFCVQWDGAVETKIGIKHFKWDKYYSGG